MNLKFKIKSYDIVFVLVFFAIVKIYAIPQVVQQTIKVLGVGIALVYFFCRSPKSVVNKTIILPCVMLLSTVVAVTTQGGTIRLLLEGILNTLCILAIGSSVCFCQNKNILGHYIKLYYTLTLIACVISVISVGMVGKSAENYGAAITYFWGNKYATSYLFVLLIGMTYLKYYNYRIRRIDKSYLIALYSLTALGVAYCTKCYTAIVAIVTMIILMLFSGTVVRKIKKILDIPIGAVAMMIIPGVVSQNISFFLQIPIIQYVITEVFGKSIGMTGRVYIYSCLSSIFWKHPFLGYGYNSNIVNRITEVGNAQNGIMELLIDYGVIGVIAVLALVFQAFVASKGKDDCWGLKIMFAGLCIFSIVEISFNYIFFLIVNLLLYNSKRIGEEDM